MVHGGLIAGLSPFFLTLLGRLRLFRVAGSSMFPTLLPGDLVLVDPRTTTALRKGDIVVARHPYRTDMRIVKRVSGILEDGRCVLVGDNPRASSDSCLFGAVPASCIVGRVVFRLSAGGAADVYR